MPRPPFNARGGKIAGSLRVPVANPDFSAFVQRANDANPKAIFILVPGGTQPAALVRPEARGEKRRPQSNLEAA